MKIYWTAGAALVGYLILAWFLGSAFKLDTTRFYLVFAILAALGIGVTAVFIWFWNKRKGSEGTASGAMERDDEIDALVREAETRLASSNLARGSKLANLPMIFVIGDSGSTKTSTIVNSGLDPELLAGNVYQDTNVVSTRLANIWFARGMIFVEAGGKLLADPQRWIRLLQRLRPGRLSSAVRGEQAPRAALLCFDAETFVRPGSAEVLNTASRNLQKRLGEISQQLGISFPVYVLFTKMNRIAFFEEFVRNFDTEEAGQVLGATLPILVQASSGTYAEEQSKRLGAAFDGLFYSMADHRIFLLPRENDPQKLPGAYEFPRELRKMRNAVVQFLVDVCRPSQLNVSPFVRGFYFSGVRPILVQDTPAVATRPSAAAQQNPFETASSATGFFKAGGVQPPPTAPLVQSGSGTRKVPQWVFLVRLFTNVILQDKNALSASGSSTKTNTMQRILLAAAALIFLFFAIGFTFSFVGNKALIKEASDAAAAIPAGEANGMNLPSQAALQKLEELRQQLVKLTGYKEDGAPFGLRWFLYTGDDLYREVRRLYYGRFNQLLFIQTQGQMLGSLRMVAIPPNPTDDYAKTYDTLKAYLITTSESKRSSNWLPPVLLKRWTEGRQVDAALLPLASKQFDFYSADLVRSNPFSEKNDSAAIDRARQHLSKFSGTEQIYQFMLADASRRSKKINFNEQFPGSAEIVVNSVDVPGAYTKAGWTAMQENLAKADKFFGGERWVLGDYAAAQPDLAKLREELGARYTAEYIEKWREFMRSSRVVRYAGLKDAVKKLNTLSGAQTPLMALFWVASQNTSVGSAKLAEAFDSVQKVVPPPATTVQYVWPTNQEYMGALAALQSAINQVADVSGPPDPNIALPVKQSADSAHNIVKKMGYTFKIDPEAHVETLTTKLLESPIEYVDALTKGMGSGEINVKAGRFCSDFAKLSSKFPFNSTAKAEVTLQELGSIFRPRDGQLWTFYNDTLQRYLQKQGAQYVANPSSNIQLTPGFIAFFNAAARFSDAMYPGGANDPNLRYSLNPQKSDQIKEMSVTIDGQTTKGQKQYVWTGNSGHSVKISAKLQGGSDFDFQDRTGMWSLFRFFADADRWSQGGNGYLLEWIVRQGREGRPVTVGGKELTYRFVVDTGGAAPVFQKEFLSGMRCVSQAAK